MDMDNADYLRGYQVVGEDQKSAGRDYARSKQDIGHILKWVLLENRIRAAFDFSYMLCTSVLTISIIPALTFFGRKWS
jgi:hypothetical protein